MRIIWHFPEAAQRDCGQCRKDGKQDGIGVYYNPNGEKKYGNWNAGKRLEWLEEADYNKRLENQS